MTKLKSLKTPSIRRTAALIAGCTVLSFGFAADQNPTGQAAVTPPVTQGATATPPQTPPKKPAPDKHRSGGNKSGGPKTPSGKPSPWEKEIVYQIFPRSFWDSTGDTIGDIKGIEQKLDYIQSLGVTTILVNPIFASRLYHNYFADDFMKVDPNFGTNEDLLSLVRAAHKKHIKIVLDMEVQYVTDRNDWYQAVQKDPKSRYADYLTPDIALVPEVLGYNGTKVKIEAINPYNPDVVEYIKSVFRFWIDPYKDKSAGVDGFRIDHMMDDLDNKKVKTGMLEKFWLPIEQDIWKIRPNAFFIGEQSDWGTGADLFKSADVNAVFAFPLQSAIASFDKAKIETEIKALSANTPTGKTQFVFIENHDTNRFASSVKNDPNMTRLGAVLNLTLKGTPIIYYGQELGMRGMKLQGLTDGNDIPDRLAFRWAATRDSPGSCIWYKNTGPWWTDKYSADHDGISLAEETTQKDSLYHFYRRLIELRKKTPALLEGPITLRTTENAHLVEFERGEGGHKVLIAVNLSGDPQPFALGAKEKVGKDLWEERGSKPNLIPAYGFKIVELK